MCQAFSMTSPTQNILLRTILLLKKPLYYLIYLMFFCRIFYFRDVQFSVFFACFELLIQFSSRLFLFNKKNFYKSKMRLTQFRNIQLVRSYQYLQKS